MNKKVAFLLISLMLIVSANVIIFNSASVLPINNCIDLKYNSYRSTNGSIHGIVYENGPQISGAGIYVYTLNETPELVNQTTTDAFGYYQINNIPATPEGITYNVTLTAPYGHYDQYNNSVIVISGIATQVNFSYHSPPGNIQGHVELVQVGVSDKMHDSYDVTNVIIKVENTPRYGNPDENGYFFTLFIYEGVYNVSASLEHYTNVTKQVTVISNSIVTVNFTLIEEWPVTISPSHDETNISIDSNIEVIFEIPMNLNTINTTTLKLLDSKNNPVPGTNDAKITVSDNDMKFIFNPPQDLEYDEKYTIMLDANYIMSADNDLILHRNRSNEFITESAPPSEPEPESGDWVITNTTIVENQIIILNGNLTIEPGGNLTLRNVTLRLNCTDNGTYHIEVKSNGSLVIVNSNITVTNREYRTYWNVQNPSHFELHDSEISYFGWNGTFWGLVVEADHTRVENCNFSNCHVGITYENSNKNIISNCEFYENFYGLYFINSFGNEIKGCEISKGIYGIVCENSSYNNMTACKISHNQDAGILLLESHYNFIIDCTVTHHTVPFYSFEAKGIHIKKSYENQIFDSNIMYNSFGIYFEVAPWNLVENCEIINNEVSGIKPFYSADCYIVDCRILNNYNGVELWGAFGCEIINCNISYNNHAGSRILDSYGNIFYNCTMIVNKDGFVFVGESLDNEIINCTLENTIHYDFNLTSEANVILINTSINNSYIHTANSNLTVNWYLNLFIIDFEGNIPQNATILIKNRFDEIVFNGTLDNNGQLRWFLLPQNFIGEEIISYDPYTIIVKTEELMNTTELDINSSKNVYLVLKIHDEPEPDEDKDKDDEDGIFQNACLCITVFIIILMAILILNTYIFKRKLSKGKIPEPPHKPSASIPQGKVKCSECGAFVPAEASSCPRCGEPFEGDEFECPGCGATVREDEKVCNKCGKEFQIPELHEVDDSEGHTKQESAGKFYCSDCGGVVDEHNSFCPACGEIFDEDGDVPKNRKPGKKLKKGKTKEQEFMCSMCGAKVSGGAGRCPMCKTEFE